MSREPRTTGAMPLSLPIQSVPDQPSFRRLRLDEPQLLLLRELSRAEETLLEEFRRSANRLRDQLHRFYPQMLQLCSAADEPWLWDLIDLAPTPAQAALLSEEQVRRVLKAYRIRRVKAQEVLTCLQAPALPVAPGATEAAQAHCGFLLPCLRVLAEQLQACSRQVSALLHTLAEEPGEGEGHRMSRLCSPSLGSVARSRPGCLPKPPSPWPNGTIKCCARMAGSHR